MIGSHLQAYLVKVLHAAGEFGILGLSPAEIGDINEVSQHEDVDANVWVLQAGHSDYCVEKPSQKEDYAVVVFGKLSGTDPLIHAADLLFDCV